jgi:hypothetical protein
MKRRAQQQAQQHQQAFGLQSGISQMPGAGPMHPGPSQQQPFHDPAANHPQSAHMPGFNNMAMNQAPSRNADVLQRQLALMNAAQNQQPQNGAVKFAQHQQLQQQQINQMREREQQQQQAAQQQQQQPQSQFQSPSMAHSSPPDIFSPGMSNEAIRRPSPHPTAIPQQVPNLPQTARPPQPNVQQRPVVNMQELTTRIGLLRGQIEQGDREFAAASQALNSVRGTASEGDAMQKVKEVQMSNVNRREYLQKHMALFANYQCVLLWPVSVYDVLMVFVI